MSVLRYCLPGVVAVMILQGCSVYNSRYYYQEVPRPRCVSGICLAPRVFAYQDQKGSIEKWKAVDSFQISFRVWDDSYRQTDDELHKTPLERAADADSFRHRVNGIFAVDSLVLQDGSRRPFLTLWPDTSSLLPRAANCFTLRFGKVQFKELPSPLRAVVHVTRRDTDQSGVSDSLLFDMALYDYHEKGLPIMREQVRGYED